MILSKINASYIKIVNTHIFRTVRILNVDFIDKKIYTNLFI